MHCAHLTAAHSLNYNSFELRRRSALQSLDSNMSLKSAAQKPSKPSPYVTTGGGPSPMFASQSSVPSSNYFQHQHAMGAGTFNPLCVQGRNGYYNPYGYSNFSTETKPPTPNFPTLNAMNLGGMAFNGFGSPFASDSTHERVEQDFDL